MRLILCAYVLFGATLALCADTGQYAPGISELHAAPMGDKLLHMLFSGGLALLLNCAALRSGRFAPAWALLWGTLTAAALCTVEEATNLFTPYRGADLLDLAANYTGILVLGAAPLALLLTVRRRWAPIRGV